MFLKQKTKGQIYSFFTPPLPPPPQPIFPCLLQIYNLLGLRSLYFFENEYFAAQCSWAMGGCSKNHSLKKWNHKNIPDRQHHSRFGNHQKVLYHFTLIYCTTTKYINKNEVSYLYHSNPSNICQKYPENPTIGLCLEHKNHGKWKLVLIFHFPMNRLILLG